MKSNLKLISTGLIITLLFIGLVLTACNAGTPTPAALVTEAVGSASTSAAGNCLIGTWNLSDFTAYMSSIEANISAKTNNEFTITSSNFTGVATFVFKPDNTATFSADNFSQSFSMSTNVGGTSLDIPITLGINGSSTSNYSVDGDKISFSGQDNGNIVITMNTMGTAHTLDQGLFGSPDTVQLYQYSCVDANTLSLKVIAVTNMDLAPLILKRAP